MFANLTEKLTKAFKQFSGQILTEANIRTALQDIRIALLEADVALPVVKEVLDVVTQKALGQEVMTSLRPSEMLVKIVHDELLAIMGDAHTELNFNVPAPVVILVAGLQGSGKTTTVAKLAKFIKERHKKKVLLVSTDIYRPAAIDQLAILAKQIDVSFVPSNTNEAVDVIASKALLEAKNSSCEVVIIDTAGRLHVDEQMMAEIAALHEITKPTETLFVVDSMTGQDAVNTARAFSERLPLTGVVLTKVDGDARGGAALSVRMITGKPIKFLGVGEKLDALEVFHPDRIVSSILGMGDVLGMIEKVQEQVDQAKAEKLAKKIAKGRGFDLEDFREQLGTLRKMGGIGSILGKLPGMGGAMSKLGDLVKDDALTRMEAIINSMTMRERRFPAHIKSSHKQRIAKGSGTNIPEVNRLLKQFMLMEKNMKRFKGMNPNMLAQLTQGPQ